MRPLLTFIFSLFFLSGFGQNWQWWVGQYQLSAAEQQLAVATNSSGQLTFLVNSNSLRSSLNNQLQNQKLQGSFLVEMNQNGSITQQKPTKRNIRRLFYNEADELFALIKNTTDSNATYKLCRIDQNLNLTDSTDIITFFKGSGVKSEWDDPQIIFNKSFVGFITKVSGYYRQGGEKKAGSGYFIGWMAYSQSGGFFKLFTHFIDRDPLIIENENPQVAFNGQYLAAIHKGNDDSLYLYNYSLQTPIDSVLIPSNLYSVSIANTIGSDKLYALVSFKNDFDWKGSWQFTGKDRMVMFSLDEQLDITNSIHKPLTYKVLKGSRTAESGLALFGGYNSLMFPLERVQPNRSTLGYIEIDTGLNTLDSTLFEATIAPYQSQYGDTRQSVLLPYRDGTYQLFPNLIWRNATPESLQFENSPLLSTQLDVNIQNLLLHSTERTFSLTAESTCRSLKLKVIGPTGLIRDVDWTINGSPRTQNGIVLTELPENDGWVKTCATITHKTGLQEQVCDSFYFGSNLTPRVTMITSVACQWEPLEFESKTQFNGTGIEGHTWEFWKNDTVFVSDTTENPTVIFTESGVYTLKYYANDGVCKKGITLLDTITIREAIKAKIVGIPWPVCQGLELNLKAKDGDKNAQFIWNDGSNARTKKLDTSGSYWVTLSINHSNGCVTHDSARFTARPSGGEVINHVVTNNDFKPRFFLSTTSFYQQFGLRRSNPDYTTQLYWKPDHTDVGIDLQQTLPEYTLTGIDECQQETVETWTPVVLGHNPKSGLLEWNGPHDQGFRDTLTIADLNSDGVEKVEITGLRSFDIETYPHHKFQVHSYLDNSGKLQAISNEWENSLNADFIIPNAFSPNGDGINDIFSGVQPRSTEIESIQIFARNGQVVQHTDDIQNIWDGKVKGLEAPVGTYTYVISYQQEGESKSLSGGVMLVK